MNSWRNPLLLLCLASLACSRDGRGSRGEDTTALVVTGNPPPLAWMVSDSGVGPLQIGMTLSEAARAAGVAMPDTTALTRECGYLQFDTSPAPVKLMWVHGLLARVEVREMGTVTEQGIGVGSTVADIQHAYENKATVQPGKYDQRAKVLTVRIGADTTRRMVFETDSAGRVTAYRVGRSPAVDWVEGCS